MSSWSADGLVTGYDPSVFKPGQIFHLASSGSVDLLGETRMQYGLNSAYSATTYPNQIKITAPFTFTAADQTNNPGKALSMAVFTTSASYFPAGKVPTPSEILALGDSKVTTYWGDVYWSNLTSTQTRTFNLIADSAKFLPLGKMWILVCPVAVTNTASAGPSNMANVKPIAGVSVNTIGRALSLMPNQRPTKPVINTPLSGYSVASGNTFTMTYSNNDPDATTPDDANRYNADLAGVQFQCRPAPTVDNPNPVWGNLPFWTSGGFSADAAYIRGNGPQTAASVHDAARRPWLTNRSIDIQVGVGDITKRTANTGQLSTGSWQLRMRTFDFGHPYPASVDPLGVKLSSTSTLAIETYPSKNTSDWSDPITVIVPVQVPPAVPESPVQNVAVASGDSVRLDWLYRNTLTPPSTQRTATVQMRKVGDISWKTVYHANNANDYAVIPPVLAGSPAVAPISPLVDGTFESGSVDGWTGVPTGYSMSYTGGIETPVISTKGPRSGSKFLGMNYTTPSGTPPASWTYDVPGFFRVFSPDPTHDTVDFSGWVKCGKIAEAIWSGTTLVTPEISVYNYFITYTWLDAANNIIQQHDGSGSQVHAYNSSAIGYTWSQFNYSLLKPAGATKIAVGVYAFLAASGNNNLTYQVTPDVFGIDDVTFVSHGSGIDNFTMAATNQYEWRVQTIDNTGYTSDYSTPGRFWVVPSMASGSVIPAPATSIDGGSLGCGTHRVFIYRRGGSARVGELTGVSYVDWGRTRDDMSTSKIVVSGWDIDRGNLLSQLQSWAYEVVIFRDNGYKTERVWEGPITLLTYETDAVTIQAKDVLGFAYRRIIRQAMSDAAKGDTVTNRAVRVLQNAFAPDDPNVLAYLRAITLDDDAKQYRSTPAFSRTAFEELDDMAANAGLDYTVVGRSILVWDTSHRIGTLPEFRDSDLGAPPIVSEYGMSMANVYAISDGNGVYGVAARGGIDVSGSEVSGNDPTYGLVEMLSSTWASDSQDESGTLTAAGVATMQQSFKDSAERSIADRYPPPVVVRVPDNTTLNPSAQVSIQQLVPGVVIPLRSSGTLRQVYSSQKLDSIKVTEQGGSETIQITMSPFNTDDALTSEETAQ